MFVVVYNGLGSNKSTIVRLPVSVDGHYHVTKLGNQPLQSQLMRSSPSPFTSIQTGATSAKFVLLFDTGPLAPVGATVFRVSKSLLETQEEQVPMLQSRNRFLAMGAGKKPSEVVASNGLVTVHFDR